MGEEWGGSGSSDGDSSFSPARSSSPTAGGTSGGSHIVGSRHDREGRNEGHGSSALSVSSPRARWMKRESILLLQWPVDDHAQVAIQGEPVARANARGGLGNARDAREPVLSSDDRAMDQHSATAFDDARR